MWEWTLGGAAQRMGLSMQDAHAIRQLIYALHVLVRRNNRALLRSLLAMTEQPLYYLSPPTSITLSLTLSNCQGIVFDSVHTMTDDSQYAPCRTATRTMFAFTLTPLLLMPQ